MPPPKLLSSASSQRVIQMFFVSFFRAVTRERNASGHWQARTVTVQLDWPTSVAVGVCYMQLFAFTWLCIQFRVLILSATRNFTLLDLNLISHVSWPRLTSQIHGILGDLRRESNNRGRLFSHAVFRNSLILYILKEQTLLYPTLKFGYGENFFHGFFLRKRLESRAIFDYWKIFCRILIVHL